MYKNKVIGVVVPAYNEELLIAEVLKNIPEFVDKIIVVDDRSKDDTNDTFLCLRQISRNPLTHLAPVSAGACLCVRLNKARNNAV